MFLYGLERTDMASTGFERTEQRGRQSGTDRNARNEKPKVLTSTETRRSFLTSEFWIALAMALVLVIVGYADDNGLGVNRAWELAAGVIGLYILSRGIAKAGSYDPQIRDLNDYR
jgi:hypothetical protein